MVKAEGVLGKVQKSINKGTKVCNIISGLYKLYAGHKNKKLYKEDVSETTKLREKFRYGQQQMVLVMEAASVVASYAPPGIREYLEYNLSAFAACGKTFDRVYNHSKKIEELSTEVFAMMEKAFGHKKKSLTAGDITLFDDKFKKMHKNLSLGEQLDLVEKIGK